MVVVVLVLGLVVRPHRGGQHGGEEEALARLGHHLPALLSEGGGRRRWGRRHRQDLVEVLRPRRTLTVTGDWWGGPGGRRRILLACRVAWTVGTGQTIAGPWCCLNTLPSWLSFTLHLLSRFGTTRSTQSSVASHPHSTRLNVVELSSIRLEPQAGPG